MFGIRPEQEQRKVSTTGRWEDIWRPLLQGIGIWLISIWQIIASLAALTSWAYAWSQSKAWEGPRNLDVGNLLSAAVWIASPFAFGVIVSNRRVQSLIGRIGNYDDVSLSPSFNAAVVIACAILSNVLFNRTVVYVLLTSQILPVMATIIAVTSWPTLNTIKQSWRLELLMQAAQNSDQWHIAKENNRHALEVLILKHEWELDSGSDVQELRNQISIAEQSANALAQELDEVRARPPDMVVIPSNHGTARFIGDRKFTGNEVDALTRYITGWAERGTGVKAWATVEGRSKYNGQGISDPQWRKFTDMLKAIGYMDGQNQPTLQADDILSRFKLTPPPEVVAEPEGVNPIVEPNQTKPNQEILQSAIDKIPQRRTAK